MTSSSVIWATTRVVFDVDTLVRCLASYHAGERVALCHGVFDMIHAGHIQHFRAAKDDMDVLVVGITPDRFVTER